MGWSEGFECARASPPGCGKKRVIMKRLLQFRIHVPRGEQPRIAATQVSISASGCALAIIAANIYPDIGSNMFRHRG